MPEPAIRPYLFFAAALFVAAFLTGVFAPPALKRGLVDAFQAATEPYASQSGGVVFLFVLVNNLTATILMLLLGVAFGIPTMFGVVSNGLVLGVLWIQAAGISGYGRAVLAVLPHGVFEIPAMLLAAAYGLWLGMAVLQRARGRNVLPVKGRVTYALRKYAEMVLPLLVIAAAIETALAIAAGG